MIGFEDEPQKSAEICIMEINGENLANKTLVNGYGIHPLDDPKLDDEFYKDQFQINAEEFHIYAVDWQPNKVDFYIDNKFVRSINESPDYPMQLMLNIYEIPVDGVSNQDGKHPKELEIDNTRGYIKKKHSTISYM